jgi:hypothetical protein
MKSNAKANNLKLAACACLFIVFCFEKIGCPPVKPSSKTDEQPGAVHQSVNETMENDPVSKSQT